MNARILVSLGLAALGGMVSGAWAEEAPPPRTAEPAAALEGLKVGVDPATGRLRPLTAAEAQALDGGAARKAVRAATPQPMASSVPGARGVSLGLAHLSFARAERQADGRIAMRCDEDGERGPSAAPEAHHD